MMSENGKETKSPATPLIQQDEAKQDNEEHRWKHWKIIVATLIFKIYQGGIAFSMGIFVPTVAEEFETGRTEAGLISSLLTLCFMVLSPVSAQLIRKFSHTKVAIIGVLLSIFGFVSAGLSMHIYPSLPIIYAAISILVGQGFSCLSLVTVDIIRDYFTSNMGLAIGIAMSGAGIGQLVMAPLMQLVLRNYGLKNSFMLIGAFITLCILPIYTIYRETSRHPIMSQNEKKKSIKKIYKEIFGSFDIILMLLLLVLIAIPIDVGMAYNLDRAEFFGISDINASYLLSIAGISNSLGKILVGQLTDCLRHRIFSLTFVLMLANAVTFAFSDFFPSWLGQAAGNSAFGFFLGAYSSTSAVLFKVMCADNATECTGLWFFSWGLAALGGPGIVGPWFDKYHSYRGGYFLVSGIAAAGVMLIPVSYKMFQKRTESTISSDD